MLRKQQRNIVPGATFSRPWASSALDVRVNDAEAIHASQDIPNLQVLQKRAVNTEHYTRSRCSVSIHADDICCFLLAAWVLKTSKLTDAEHIIVTAIKPRDIR